MKHLLIFASLIFATACSPGSGSLPGNPPGSSAPGGSNSNNGGDGGTDQGSGQGTPENGNNNGGSAQGGSNDSAYVPPLWESVRPESGEWSDYVGELIDNELSEQLLPGSDDIEDFCPNYENLNDIRRINFWMYLISAMAKYESGFNPLSRYVETTMGIDPITGKQVVSEGLLQLSYQDVRFYLFCKFDWVKDRLLSDKDPRKTILDPFKNLDCGTRILARQVMKKKKIALATGVYWAVLRIGHTRLPQIQALTKGLPFCK